jgi:sigma-54-specific transcriptional regulator
MPADHLITLPDSASPALSIRAKALLFHDPRSLAVLEQVERVAGSDATVLVVGETGTGKELIARHIHKRSGRDGPFIAVNCGAFSESLIDAELFGHESGAFTGANQARAGWFEAANGGTLFLDEIGDLPLALQVKLLRVLQERQVVRLGSRRAIPLDVRLVAATNVELHRAVEAQHFRADLYFRLSVATIELPPLRDRPGDILPLARHFIAVCGGKLSLHGTQLSPEARSALLAYAWPGNIRELENVIHYALIVCRDGIVRASDCRFSPLGFLGAVAPSTSSAAATAATAPPSAGPPPVADPLAALERAIGALMDGRHPQLVAAIEALVVRLGFARCHDNQVQTARLLGVTRNTLRTLLKRHGLLALSAQAEVDEAVEVETA